MILAVFLFSILTIFPPGVNTQESNMASTKNVIAQFVAAEDEISIENENTAAKEGKKGQTAQNGKTFLYEDADLTMTTDKEQDEVDRDTLYKPGSIAYIDTVAPLNTLNGSVKCRLESPTQEEVFDFGSQSNVNISETKTEVTRKANFTRDGITTELTANLTTLIESTDRVTVNVSIDLPSFPLYFGHYWFTLFVFAEVGAQIEESRYNATLIITDLTTFIVNTTFVQRGWKNDTPPDFETEYNYVEEPNTTVFSPGDNVVFIGRLNCSTSPESYFRTGYMNLTEGEITRNDWTALTWNESIFPNIEPISWLNGSLWPWNASQINVAHGNFTFNNLTADELQYYYALNFEIVERGIFGKINFTLSVNFIRNHTSTGSGWPFAPSVDFIERIKYPSIDIKYRLNLKENNFDRIEYQLTDLATGNFTVESLNYNLDKINEQNATIWTLDPSINIPLTDIHFRIYMNNSIDEEEFSLFKVRHTANYTFQWIQQIDPNFRNGTYGIHLRWLDPIKGLNDTSASKLTWTAVDTPFYSFSGGTQFNITILGSLVFRNKMEELGMTTTVQREDVIDLMCRVWYTERFIDMKGLDLYALLNNNTERGKYLVVESDATYHVFFSAAFNETIGQHTMHFYKSWTDEYLGFLTFEVVPKPVIPEPIDPKEGIGLILGVVGALGIVLGYAAIVFVFIRPFRKK